MRGAQPNPGERGFEFSTTRPIVVTDLGRSLGANSAGSSNRLVQDAAVNVWEVDAPPTCDNTDGAKGLFLCPKAAGELVGFDPVDLVYGSKCAQSERMTRLALKARQAHFASWSVRRVLTPQINPGSLHRRVTGT